MVCMGDFCIDPGGVGINLNVASIQAIADWEDGFRDDSHRRMIVVFVILLYMCCMRIWESLVVDFNGLLIIGRLIKRQQHICII